MIVCHYGVESFVAENKTYVHHQVSALANVLYIV